MKKIFACCVIIIVLFSLFGINGTYCLNVQTSSARGMCVLDGESYRVLYEKDKDKKLACASTTKVVTAITVIENCSNLDEIIKIDAKAVGIEGTSIYLRQGEEISVKNLLYGLMLRSGNDAATALAIHTSGSVQSFATLMNDTARNIGATNSNFTNPHGLDEKYHYTTAYDLALISAYALKNPIFTEIVSTSFYTVPKTNLSEIRYFKNKNRLLNSLDGCIGVKTGFTSDAGRCLVSATKRQNMTVVCVVLNCGPMFEESCSLLNASYNDYEYAHIVKSDTKIFNEYYIDSKQGRVYLYSKNDFYYPIKPFEREKIRVKYQTNIIDKSLDAGSEVGEIYIYFDNHLLKTLKLYTINKIDILTKDDVLKSITLQWME